MDAIYVFLGILYIGIFGLYILLIILFIRACNATIETKEIVKNIAYRDTARFISEARRGLITAEDQDAAEIEFNGERT